MNLESWAEAKMIWLPRLKGRHLDIEAENLASGVTVPQVPGRQWNFQACVFFPCFHNPTLAMGVRIST
jgi:hypothetical protein